MGQKGNFSAKAGTVGGIRSSGPIYGSREVYIWLYI